MQAVTADSFERIFSQVLGESMQCESMSLEEVPHAPAVYHYGKVCYANTSHSTCTAVPPDGVTSLCCCGKDPRDCPIP